MKPITILYFLVAAVNLTAINVNADVLQHTSKILLMPLLVASLAIGWQGPKGQIYWYASLALLLSWAGDILLIFSNSDPAFFIYGLAAFLLAHLAYIITYLGAQSTTGEPPNRIFIASRVLILAFAGGAFLNVLWMKLGDYRVYVAAYTAVILLMAVFALLRRGRTSANSFAFVYGGALLFIVSDGMIAVSRFLHPFDYQGEMIMTTYIFAQYFIVRGLLAHAQFIYTKA